MSFSFTEVSNTVDADICKEFIENGTSNLQQNIAFQFIFRILTQISNDKSVHKSYF